MAPRVDFYVLEESAPLARLKLACRLTEKAYLAAQSVLVWHTQAEELQSFDALLWTFADGSFVPHEMLPANGAASGTAVLLSAGVPPDHEVDVLINLAANVPPCANRATRIVEIIDGEESRRREGRVRFKAYRDQGVQPATHNIRSV